MASLWSNDIDLVKWHNFSFTLDRVSGTITVVSQCVLSVCIYADHHVPVVVCVCRPSDAWLCVCLCVCVQTIMCLLFVCAGHLVPVVLCLCADRQVPVVCADH